METDEKERIMDRGCAWQTEVMWVKQQREELNIMLERKGIKQGVYIGGMVTKGGCSEVEVRRRIQAVASARRKVEGVKTDGACETPYDVEAVALREQQELCKFARTTGSGE